MDLENLENGTSYEEDWVVEREVTIEYIENQELLPAPNNINKKSDEKTELLEEKKIIEPGTLIIMSEVNGVW